MSELTVTVTPEEIAKRKRRSTLVLIVISIFALFGFLAFWFFGPNPKIVVSKETTHITAPLAADGYPDYHAVLLADMKQGVTPDNNGAIPFVRTYWSEISQNMSPEQKAWFLKELGIDEPAREDSLTPIDTPANRRSALAVLRKHLNRSKPDPNYPFTQDQISEIDPFFNGPVDEVMHDDRLNEFIWGCEPVERPWTRNELSFLADWIEENEAAIDRLVEAAESKDWYMPFGPPEANRGLIGYTLWIQITRDATRMLQTRSMYYLGTKQYDKAARDAVTIIHIAKKLANKSTFQIDSMVTIAISSIGYQQVKEIASNPDVPLSVLKYLQQELEVATFQCNLFRVTDIGQRYAILDNVLGEGRIEFFPRFYYGGEVPQHEKIAFFLASRLSVDWNQFLKILNDYYDKSSAIYALPTYRQQCVAAEALLNNLEKQRITLDQVSDIYYFSSPYSRGVALGRYLLSDGWDPLSYSNAYFRNTNDREICRLVVALSVYRALHDKYPESLDELTPKILAKLPLGAFSEKPFEYRRIVEKNEEGYLLYALGVNGVDDGGSCSDMHTRTTGISCSFQGIEPYANQNEAEKAKLYDSIPEAADDPSYRLPRRLGEWPWEMIDLP